MNRHFRSQVRLSCDGKLTRNRANSNFHPQLAIVILAPIWNVSELQLSTRNDSSRKLQLRPRTTISQHNSAILF